MHGGQTRAAHMAAEQIREPCSERDLYTLAPHKQTERGSKSAVIPLHLVPPPPSFTDACCSTQTHARGPRHISSVKRVIAEHVVNSAPFKLPRAALIGLLPFRQTVTRERRSVSWCRRSQLTLRFVCMQ